jgi:hypothetical protein
VGQEVLDPRTSVPTHQHPAPGPRRQLSKGGVEDLDLVGGIVGVGVARTQQRGQRLPGAPLVVVDERQHRMEPEPAFEVRGGMLLLRVRTHQRGVQVNDHLTGHRDRRPMRPHLGAGRSPSRPDRGDRRVGIDRQSLDQPTERGIGGHRPKQFRLGTNHRHIGQAITTQGDSDREIEHHLARVMHRTTRPPRLQRHRQRPAQATDRRRPQQHRRPRRREQRLAARLHTNTATSRDTLHLRSAFPLETLGPS